MHPSFSYELAQARASDLRHQAKRATCARAARKLRPGRRAGARCTEAELPAPGRRERRRRSPGRVLAIASLGSAVAFVDATIVNIAFPDIARSFPGTSITTLSWVLNGYNVVFAAFLMAGAGIAETARPTELIAVDQADFSWLLRTSPALSSALNRSLSRRLQDARAETSAPRARPATVALLAVDGRVRPWLLAARLGAALKAYMSVGVLDSAEVPRAELADDPAAVYGPLLDGAEAAHDLVVLVGGLDPDEPWTRFCRQHADRILAVTGGGPVPSALRSYPELQGCELVACDVGPGALNGWADALDPVASHVIRESEFRTDVARMARRLAGTSVGVVLSGGGARAFSHIGVLEELTAAGVTIDRIAGVSMGAVIGGLFAMGHDADEIDAICFEESVQRRPLRDFAFPRHSLIRGNRMRSMLHRRFGTRLIEELPRSFICGSAELRSHRLEIARYGPLWEAVGLSICLPIIAPPEVRGRDIFVDGSLIDNLPVKAMADMGEGPVIAVDVKAKPERRTDGPDDRDRGAGDRPPRLPGLGETLTRILLLGSENTSASARRHADLVIRPRAEGVGLLEFEQLDAAREAGRVAAREALERAPAGLVA